MDAQKFLSHTEPTDDGCWKWLRSHFDAGYGVCVLDGKTLGAHVVSHLLFNGEVTEGYHVHHTCNKKWCCFPGHLVALSPSDHRKAHSDTHCLNGHELTDENTVIVQSKGRSPYKRCRTCLNDAAYRYYHKNKKLKPPMTHCKRGHSLEDAYVSNGRRHCRQCRVIRNKKYRQKTGGNTNAFHRPDRYGQDGN